MRHIKEWKLYASNLRPAEWKSQEEGQTDPFFPMVHKVKVFYFYSSADFGTLAIGRTFQLFVGKPHKFCNGSRVRHLIYLMEYISLSSSQMKLEMIREYQKMVTWHVVCSHGVLTAYYGGK